MIDSPSDPTKTQSGNLFQPIFSGLLASLVGFASSFAIILQGFDAVGARQAQGAAGV